MTQLVECVPNVSEGRDAAVVAAIAAAAASVPRVRLLDTTSDADHHRSVITFVGTPDAVAEAAFRLIEAAARLIDLTAHRGQHPRVGAADVVPFVPLGATSMATCVALAHSLGERVAAALSLPVYFYEAAALRPERANLADVRRGGYEALQTAIAQDERAPDRGPRRIGPAGAVIIGARRPLIAFNVFLTTAEVRIAQAVARAVRASGGGLPAVKALGLLVGGQAQVSMNLTDYTATSLLALMSAVRREAAALGVDVDRSELIGLMPQQAALDALAACLRLPALTPARLLYDHYDL